MQHPVGYTTNNSTHQPQLNNIWALFTNPVFLWGYTHVVLASLVTGRRDHARRVSAWHLHRKNQVEAFRRTAVISLVVLLPAVAFNLFVGSELGVVEGTYQPMKIAAAEALWSTCDSHCAVLPLPDRRREQRRDADADHQGPRPAVHPGHQPPRRHGAGPQQPQCRSTRRSTGRGTTSPMSSFSTGRCGSWPTWPRWSSSSRCGGPGSSTGAGSTGARWFLRIAPWVVILPFLINTAGWMLTENGRQPWIVQGLMLTKNGVSPRSRRRTSGSPWSSSTLIYAVLGVANTWLMIRFGRRSLGDDPLAKITDDSTGGRHHHGLNYRCRARLVP